MIAIVDDDAGARTALEALLRSLRYNTCTFGSGDDFLNSGKLYDFSCLITDLHMPGMSGFDLQDRLLAIGHRLPVIIITGDPNSTARARAMKSGAICFLAKPHDTAHLIECIEKALQTKSQPSARR